MKSFLFIISSLGLFSSLFANINTDRTQIPTESEVNALSGQMLQAASAFKTEVEEATAMASLKSEAQTAKAKAMRDIGLSKYQSMHNANTVLSVTSQPAFMVFVSLSMPDQTLQAINQQAARLKVPVFIRGFYQNDLTATVNRIAEIMGIDLKVPKAKQQALGGFSIDPVRFEAFGITDVPAFVLVDPSVSLNGEQGINDQDFEVITGNIALMDAIDIFKQKASAHLKPFAEAIKV